MALSIAAGKLTRSSSSGATTRSTWQDEVRTEESAAPYTAGVATSSWAQGLTIAGAMLTPATDLAGHFNSLAYPSAMALIISGRGRHVRRPAILVVGSRFRAAGLKRMKTRGWRKVGTATVRWPKPILGGPPASCVDSACWR